MVYVNGVKGTVGEYTVVLVFCVPIRRSPPVSASGCGGGAISTGYRAASAHASAAFVNMASMLAPLRMWRSCGHDSTEGGAYASGSCLRAPAAASTVSTPRMWEVLRPRYGGDY